MELADPVLAEDGDGIRTLVLNRPHVKNAMDDAGFGRLREELLRLRHDRSVRTVIIRGSGGDLSSGADVGATKREGHPLDRMAFLSEVTVLLHELPQPVIAQVDGVAVGAGLSLMLACDLSVATPRSRFSMIYSRRGLSPDLGATWLLPRAVGMTQAKRLMLLADLVEADEALQMGLITWVRSADEIDAFVDDLAARLAAGPPVALTQTRSMLHEAATGSLQQALLAESRVQAINQVTDAPAARQAFIDRSDPIFTGEWRFRP